MNLLRKEQKESYENAKLCYICEEKIENKYLKDEKYCKVSEHCYCTGAGHSICNRKYNASKNIPIIFHNGSNYYYNFIIKVLAK